MLLIVCITGCFILQLTGRVLMMDYYPTVDHSMDGRHKRLTGIENRGEVVLTLKVVIVGISDAIFLSWCPTEIFRRSRCLRVSAVKREGASQRLTTSREF